MTECDILTALLDENYSEAAGCLLMRGIDPDTVDDSGDTALHWAAIHDKPAAAKLMLEHGASVNFQDLAGRTPLLVAVWFGHVDTAKVLLAKGANPEADDDEGSTPLLCAEGNDELLAVLERAVAEIAGRKPDGQDIIDAILDEDNGALEIGEAAKAVERLLAGGADPNFADAAGRTPLHWAAKFGDSKVITLLIDAGANIEAISEHDGTTPLQAAVEDGKIDKAKLLLARGADLDARGRIGWTALHCAVARRQVATVKELLELGADPYAKDEDGNTPSAYIEGENEDKKEMLAVFAAAESKRAADEFADKAGRRKIEIMDALNAQAPPPENGD